MYRQSVTLDVCTWAMIACSQMQSSCFCSHYLCKKGCHVNRNNGSLVKPSANNYRSALIAQAHNQSPVPIESNLLKMQQQRTCRAAYRLGCNKHNTTHLLVANYIDPPLSTTSNKHNVWEGIHQALYYTMYVRFLCYRDLSNTSINSTYSGEQSNPRQPIQTNQNSPVPRRIFIVCKLASFTNTHSYPFILFRSLSFILFLYSRAYHIQGYVLPCTGDMQNHFLLHRIKSNRI